MKSLPEMTPNQMRAFLAIHRDGYAFGSDFSGSVIGALRKKGLIRRQARLKYRWELTPEALALMPGKLEG